MSKSIFFYVTISLERTEKGVKIIPNQDMVKEMETYGRSIPSSLEDKEIIKKIASGEIPEFEYPTEMDIKEIEKDLKDKGVLTKVNTNKYRLKDSYVEELKSKIEEEESKVESNLKEINEISETAKDVVEDSSIPKEEKNKETFKHMNKKPWFKKRFQKNNKDRTEPVPSI